MAQLEPPTKNLRLLSSGGLVCRTASKRLHIWPDLSAVSWHQLDHTKNGFTRIIAIEELAHVVMPCSWWYDRVANRQKKYSITAIMVICDGKIGRTVVDFFGSQSATATAQESRPAKYYLYIGHSGADLLDPLTSFSLVALFSSLVRPSSKLGSKTRSDSHCAYLIIWLAGKIKEMDGAALLLCQQCSTRFVEMGCLLSTPGEASPLRRAGSIGEVAVFVPGFRIPESLDLSQPLGDCLSRGLLDRLSSLRTRMVTMAAQEARRFTKPRRITTTRHGSALSELLRALEDYLPVLLGLVKDGCQLTDKVRFVWINQEDDAEETAMTNAWYEVLSVLHLMAMLSLLQANRLLLPKISSEGYQLKISEENRRKSIDILLKAAGYLDCAIQHVLPQITPEHRKDLPLDLEEGVLRALCLQALGQCVDIQLGMAIDSPKATLAVKRRLACEMVNYWHQAQNNMAKLPSTDGWAKKHQLFIKWKYAEAKAAAYYYHGLILDEGNTEKSHGVAIAALQASEEYLKESKKACETFNSTPPTSRNPPLWGSMKYLSEKIPKDASSKIRINQDLYSEDRTFKTAPTLPDFALALKPDDYQLPPLDPLWNKEDHHC